MKCSSSGGLSNLSATSSITLFDFWSSRCFKHRLLHCTDWVLGHGLSAASNRGMVIVEWSFAVHKYCGCDVSCGLRQKRGMGGRRGETKWEVRGDEGGKDGRGRGEEKWGEEEGRGGEEREKILKINSIGFYPRFCPFTLWIAGCNTGPLGSIFVDWLFTVLLTL